MHLLSVTTRPGSLGGPGTDKPLVDVIDFIWGTATSTAHLLGCTETDVSYTQVQAEVASSDFDVFIRIEAPTYDPIDGFDNLLNLYAGNLSTFPEGWKLRIGVWITTSSGNYSAKAGQPAMAAG